MKVKIQLRRDIKENWNKVSDTVLNNGEIIIVQDIDDNGNTIMSFKIGDGKNPYKALPFVPLLDAINDSYMYSGHPVFNKGKLILALADKKKDNKQYILSKSQIFNLKFKYQNMIPEDDLGLKIENWWENELNWYRVSMDKEISIEFAREYEDQLSWETLCYYNTLSEEIMREFSNRLNWSTISSKQKLSEDFIRDFKDKLN